MRTLPRRRERACGRRRRGFAQTAAKLTCRISWLGAWRKARHGGSCATGETLPGDESVRRGGRGGGRRNRRADVAGGGQQAQQRGLSFFLGVTQKSFLGRSPLSNSRTSSISESVESCLTVLSTEKTNNAPPSRTCLRHGDVPGGIASKCAPRRERRPSLLTTRPPRCLPFITNRAGKLARPRFGGG